MDPSAAIVHGSEGPNESADVVDPKRMQTRTASDAKFSQHSLNVSINEAMQEIQRNDKA